MSQSYGPFGVFSCFYILCPNGVGLCLLGGTLRAAEANRGLAVLSLLHIAHADDTAVDGATNAIVVLAVQLGQHVHCRSEKKSDRHR